MLRQNPQRYSQSERIRLGLELQSSFIKRLVDSHRCRFSGLDRANLDTMNCSLGDASLLAKRGLAPTEHGPPCPDTSSKQRTVMFVGMRR
jgi:hypothetical protein